MTLPDRWTAHDPRRCGQDELPEGAPCSCGRFWPRPAAWWQGECAIGAKAVARLMQRYRDAKSKEES